MQNKDIIALLPELPDTYFWRIGKSGTNAAAIDDNNQVISTMNCVFLSIRQNRHFFKFKFSASVETKNLIYIGENLNRLKKEAVVLHKSFSEKLGGVSENFEVDLVSNYLGDYQRSQKGSSAVLKFLNFTSSNPK